MFRRGADDLVLGAEQPLAQVVLDRAGADARALGELGDPQMPFPSRHRAHAMNEPCTVSAAGPATAPDSCSAPISSASSRPRPARRGVLAEAGAGRPHRVGGRAAQLDRHPEQPHGPVGSRLVELDDHLPRRDQIAVERLVEPQHRLQAAVVLGAERAPLLTGARGEDLADRRDARPSPGGSNAWSSRSSRSTPRQNSAQNFGSSAPSVM